MKLLKLTITAVLTASIVTPILWRPPCQSGRLR